jgi:carbon storage regulator CsrA
MLVLTRFEGEAIHIGDDVVVKVLRFTKKLGRPVVDLGITAPPNVKIFRDDVVRKDRTMEETSNGSARKKT